MHHTFYLINWKSPKFGDFWSPGHQIFTETNGRSVQGGFGNDGLRHFLVIIGYLIFPQDNRGYYYTYRDR